MFQSQDSGPCVQVFPHQRAPWTVFPWDIYTMYIYIPPQFTKIKLLIFTMQSPRIHISFMSHLIMCRQDYLVSPFIHHLNLIFHQSPGIKTDVHQSPELIYSQFTLKKIANSRFTRNKTGHSPIPRRQVSL